MPASMHKFVFAPSAGQLAKVLRKEARTGWHPSRFEPQPVKEGVLLVLEKIERERVPKRA